MELALTFNAVEFTTITRNGQPWIGSPQIGDALGYAKGRVSIAKIYETHADEFTDEMTAVVKLPTEGGEQDVRIFSLRGCHLLAMFARTPVAKAFRKWVLDVLDTLERERQPEALPNSVTASDQAHIHAVVDAKVKMLPASVQRKAYMELWSRFNRHYGIARYNQLPSEKLTDAIEYIIGMELKAALPPSSSEIPNNSHAMPVPVDAPKQLDILHRARERCRFEFLPQAYSSLDREAAERSHLAKDLYKLQDCL